MFCLFTFPFFLSFLFLFSLFFIFFASLWGGDRPHRPPQIRHWCSGSVVVCSGSLVVTAYDFESGRPGLNPEWGLIYYKVLITAQGLPKPSSLRGSTLGTRAAEHKGCNWLMQIDLWLQPRAVFGHTFSGIIWHMPQK